MSLSHNYPWQLITAMSRPLPLSLQLGRQYDAQKLQAEVHDVLTRFAAASQHGYYHDGGWKAVCLVAANGDYREDRFLPDADYLKTEAVPRGGYLESIIDEFGETKRVRILNLTAKKNIFWHIDDGDSVDEKRVRLHIPVRTNADVFFQISHEDERWIPGQLWYGDFTFPHRIYNSGEESRIHIVMDLDADERVRSLFADEYLAQARKRSRLRKTCQWLCKLYSFRPILQHRILKR